MAKLKCSCGNTYFAKVNVNEFHDYPTNLHSLLAEVDTDFDIKIYQCIRCQKYKMPPVDYYSAQEDLKKIYNKVSDTIEGKEILPDKPVREKPHYPGEISYVKRSAAEDLNYMGKFVPQE